MKFSKHLLGIVLLFGLAAAEGQDSLQVAIAEKGDGIYSLLRKQGVDPYELYDDFVTLNQDNLRDSIQLFEGLAYKLPTAVERSADLPKIKTETKSVTGVTYPIFGKDHEVIEIRSERLEGAVYYLISGHGGPDPGAMTTYVGKSISEDEYAYDVTLRLARELLSHSAKVYVIVRDPNDGIREDRILEMDKDEVTYPNEKIPLNQLARLKQRVRAVNKLYQKHKGQHQRLIVTHVDSRTKGHAGEHAGEHVR